MDDTNAISSHEATAGRPLQLFWDDDSSGPDVIPVCTSVRVPDDYAGGGDVVLTGVAVGATGNDDWTVLFVQNRAGSGEDTVATILTQNDCETSSVYACSISLGTTFAPGDMLTVGIQRAPSADDATRLLGVHFRYTAAQ